MIALADRDVTLHVGDVLDVLATMPDASVDCVITSPPYFGLRDYGTGLWDGGNPDCDHEMVAARNGRGGSGAPGKQTVGAFPSELAADECGKCGATRVDRQIGLEPTLDAYLEKMVAVFREVRRVLAPHGTCWVNLGDSYANDTKWGGTTGGKHVSSLHAAGGGLGREKHTTGLKGKDLCGTPWRVAFALQADGWWLRSDIVWSKPNPMPESVTDRPTKAHEYVFLLTRQPRYWFDAEAVREPGEPFRMKQPDGWDTSPGGHGTFHRNGREKGAATDEVRAGRNVRSVWEIATQPYPEAHFATFPEELVRRCLLAGCPEWVCRVCGLPRTRLVDVAYENPGNRTTNGPRSLGQRHETAGFAQRLERAAQTVGWSDCGHNDYRPGRVLDPFIGSGTTAHVARKHGRHAIGVDLSAEYLKLAARRLQQLSLLAEYTP